MGWFEPTTSANLKQLLLHTVINEYNYAQHLKISNPKYPNLRLLAIFIIKLYTFSFVK